MIDALMIVAQIPFVLAWSYFKCQQPRGSGLPRRRSIKDTEQADRGAGMKSEKLGTFLGQKVGYWSCGGRWKTRRGRWSLRFWRVVTKILWPIVG